MVKYQLKLTTWDLTRSKEITKISTLRFISHREWELEKDLPLILGCCLLRSILRVYLSISFTHPFFSCILALAASSPVQSKQTIQKHLLIPVNLNTTFFSLLFIFIRIDFFMEVKLSKRKFLQNLTQKYNMKNSLTAPFDGEIRPQEK